MSMTLTNKPYNRNILTGFSGSSYHLGQLIHSDHILEGDEAVGKALLGTYVYKNAIAGGQAGYPNFYNKYIAQKNASTPIEVTLGDNTITMFVNTNGHQFYNIADKEAVDAWYEKSGKAYFFGIDTENERIFLPRKDLVSFTPKDKIKVYGDGNTLALTNDNAKVSCISSLSGYGNAHYYVPTYFTEQFPIGSASGTINQSAQVSNGKAFGVIPKSLATNGITSGVETDDLNDFKDTITYTYMVVGNTSTVTSLTTNITDDEVLQQINKNSADILNKVDKAEAANICVPDYTAGITITSGFTAPDNGVICSTSLALTNKNADLLINNVKVGRTRGGSTVQDDIPFYAIVGKGDVVTYTNMYEAYFFPMKGVN